MNTRQLAAIAALTLASTISSPAAMLTGLWEFDNQFDLGHATVGTDLVFLGGAPGTWSTSLADDLSASLFGVITTPEVSQANQIIATHNIAANGGGAYVNEWSFLVDIFSPVGSRDRWRSLVQTSQGNTNDLDYGIRPESDQVGLGSYGYSDVGIDETRWSRIVVTWRLPLSGPAFVTTYIDGALFYSHPLLSDASDGPDDSVL